MATNKKPIPQTTKAEWRGFLERPLSESELEACDGWKPKATDIWEHLTGIVASGIDVSLSYSASLKATTCTFKDQRTDSKTAGYALSARGDDALDSIRLMIYKHNAALQGDWTPLLSAPPKPKRG